MALLSIALLGTFEVVLDGQPATAFEYDKVRALLVYLAVEADRPHRRETLSGLLWPEHSQRRANRNLSQALFKLRRTIADQEASPPFLIITPQTVQFNPASDYTLDVTTFTTLLATEAEHEPHTLEMSEAGLDRFQQAAALYRGSFLEGLSVSNSPMFSEWTTLNRERLHRLAMQTLHRLVYCHQARGQYEAAIQYAWQWVALDPWQEEAQQQLMYLLAISGQRTTALAQYKTCCRLLREELGVEPAEETTRLYEQIRDRRLSEREIFFAAPPSTGSGQAHPPRSPAVTAPPFLFSTPSPPSSQVPFVARDDELAHLQTVLEQTLSGQGQVIFVTGGPGRGKTVLIQEFARRAQAAHPKLIVASGNGNAHTGIGDPYLPFREILAQLTGDVEAQWTAGVISQDQADRLWQVLPCSVQALLDVAPDLINTFLPGVTLLQRAKAFSPQRAAWLVQLEELVAHKTAMPVDSNLQQSALFEQYTRVLKTLASQVPLLLWLDDLQWVDAGSASLLFHLGRRLAGSRVMLVGVYRPAEVAQGRDGGRHPLEPIINEFKRYFGDIEVNLNRAEGRRFIDAWLDTEPNRLDRAFRQTLYGQTQGHPLFTVELLRAMQERGNLIRDQHGHWIAGSALDWETLPVRVEAVIAERLAQLPEPLRDTLTVASVEGETFTAEVVARVKRADERLLTQQLDDRLAKTYRLVQASGMRQIDSLCLSLYRFRHILFQKYLYNGLSPMVRAQLHQAVGSTLEVLYGQETAEVAVQLAWHFQQAHLVKKAVTYLQQAGEQAAQRSANMEAIGHLTKGLALLKTLPDTIERAGQELMLQITLGPVLIATRGFADPAVEQAFTRAQELCERVFTVDTPELFWVLRGLGAFYIGRAQHKRALKIGERMWQMAQNLQDSTLHMTANRIQGESLVCLGELTRACTHLEQMIAHYDPEQHRALAFRHGLDGGVVCLSWHAWALWLQGYPDQALQRRQEAVALAQKLAHPFSLAFALQLAAGLNHWRRDWSAAQQQSETLLEFSTEHGFVLWIATATSWHGLLLAEQGLAAGGIAGQKQVKEGITQMHKGLTIFRATGMQLQLQLILGSLAGVCGQAGQVEEGLKALSEALEVMGKTDERYWEAELYRIKGELLLAWDKNEAAEAETCFQHAIEVSRRQKAKSLELRAVMSLGRLWHTQGKTVEAQQRLAEIYSWFSEGFDTGDLQEAKILLEELSAIPQHAPI